MSIEPQADSNTEQASMPLDDKLKKQITKLWIEDGRLNAEKLDEAIAQIKQAFQDEYELKPKNYDAYAEIAGYMTGQEWYSRFEKELELPTNADFYTKNLQRITLEAAKRAAGLDT